MNKKQQQHMIENLAEFTTSYMTKYEKGQKEHGGNMWTMGLKQALENMEAEVLDQWSYCQQIRKCMEELGALDRYDLVYGGYDKDNDGIFLLQEDVNQIINRVKQDD